MHNGRLTRDPSPAMSLQPLARCALAATVTLAVAACASTRLPAPAPTPAATPAAAGVAVDVPDIDRKSTRLNSSHVKISYAVFCVKKKNSRVLGHTTAT